MEVTHKSQDSGSLAKKKSFKASYGLQKEQKWPIFAVTVATVANFDHFTSFDTHFQLQQEPEVSWCCMCVQHIIQKNIESAL